MTKYGLSQRHGAGAPGGVSRGSLEAEQTGVGTARRKRQLESVGRDHPSGTGETPAFQEKHACSPLTLLRNWNVVCISSVRVSEKFRICHSSPSRHKRAPRQQVSVCYWTTPPKRLDTGILCKKLAEWKETLSVLVRELTRERKREGRSAANRQQIQTLRQQTDRQTADSLQGSLF